MLGTATPLNIHSHASIRPNSASAGYHQIGAHQPQHLSRVGRQPDNPGIAALSKDLCEQVFIEGDPSAWRFVTDKEMPCLPLAQQA